MTRIAFLSGVWLFITGAFSYGADADIKHVKADEAAKLVEAGKVTVIDVRTPDEFKGGHIKGAKNIDISSETFERDLAALDKSKSYLVHCQSGGRSTRSLKTFEKLGFKDIYHLDEGFGGWEETGKPVEK